MIAGTLHRELKADLFEILPTHPYPEDYEQTVAQADGETKRGYEPPLAAPPAGSEKMPCNRASDRAHFHEPDRQIRSGRRHRCRIGVPFLPVVVIHRC